RKEEVRVEVLEKFEAKPASGAPTALPVIAGRESEHADGAAPVAAVPTVKVAAKAEAPQYTNRLLEAKRRAMRDLNPRKGDDKEEG
ncbi:hypothetical protein HY251_11170, partial [bacterium]|nr:hypothetical protein [bacterium]